MKQELQQLKLGLCKNCKSKKGTAYYNTKPVCNKCFSKLRKADKLNSHFEKRLKGGEK